jgi:hypothetical protein
VVYIFTRTGDTWVEQSTALTSSSNSVYSDWGNDLCISDGTLVVGNRLNNWNGFATGGASVFRFDYSSMLWSDEHVLLAPDGEAYDSFGRSVAVSNDVVLVGASGDDDGGSVAGAAYFFRLEGGQWTFEQKVIASDAFQGDLFGISVAISDGLALVGAHMRDIPYDNAGAVYLFRYDGSQWNEEHIAMPPYAFRDENDGWDVAIHGGRAVAGGPGADAYADERGAIIVTDGDPFDPTITDCNNNGVDDAIDIANGTSGDCDDNGQPDDCQINANPLLDCDGNGMLDSCQCLADFNNDQMVDVNDLTQVILNWAEEVPESGDVNCDGQVDVDDLSTLLNAWGSCPAQ